MKKLPGQPRRTVTDHVDVQRIAVIVETSDVGKTQPNYHGLESYTFLPDDVGRLVEIIRNVSPGFVSWGFGSSFVDLRAEFPNPKPYRVTE